MKPIEARDIGKSYSIHKHTTIRERLQNPFSFSKESFRALEGVSFSVGRGEVLGIIGANGAGKTTILKILSGITKPDKGAVQVNGRITNLIELGAGFHPELTGKENVFLQGALLGMKQGEILRCYKDIVDFAELHEFMDTPIKKYSSGMYARLGFSIAIHTKPDILLVDEVLAVGDTAFQTKCFEAIKQMRERGVAIILVSHNLSAITSLADSAIWLDRGQMRREGESHEVIECYLKHFDKKRLDAPKTVWDKELLGIKCVRLLRNGSPSQEFHFGDSLTVEVQYSTERPIAKPYFIIGVLAETEWIFQASMLYDGRCPERIEGEGRVACTFKDIPLLPGTYYVILEVVGEEAVRYYVPPRQVASFSITTPLSKYGFAERTAIAVSRKSPYTVVPYQWKHGK